MAAMWQPVCPHGVKLFIYSVLHSVPANYMVAVFKVLCFKVQQLWDFTLARGKHSEWSILHTAPSSHTYSYTSKTNKHTRIIHSSSAISSLVLLCPTFFSLGSLPELYAVSDGMLFIEIGACQASLGLDVFGWRVSLCSLIRSSLVQHACVHSGSSQSNLFPTSPLMAHNTVKNHRSGNELFAESQICFRIFIL